MAGHLPIPRHEGFSTSGVPLFWHDRHLRINRAIDFRKRIVDPLSASRGLLIGLVAALLLWGVIAAVLGVV